MYFKLNSEYSAFSIAGIYAMYSSLNALEKTLIFSVIFLFVCFLLDVDFVLLFPVFLLFILLLTVLLYKLSNFSKTNFNNFVNVEYSEDFEVHLAVHEAGHALVRLCFFEKSIYIIKQSMIIENGIIFQQVSGISFFQKLLLRRKFKTFDAFLFAAGVESEYMVFGETIGLGGHDYDHIQKNSYDKILDLRIETLRKFLKENEPLLLELAGLIIKSKKKVLEFSDLQDIHSKLKKKEFICAL
jgi:hypothetical protein